MFLSKEECATLSEFVSGYYESGGDEKYEAAAQIIGILDFLLTVGYRRGVIQSQEERND